MSINDGHYFTSGDRQIRSTAHSRNRTFLLKSVNPTAIFKNSIVLPFICRLSANRAGQTHH